MKSTATLGCCLLMALAGSCNRQTESDWKGPGRNGIYPGVDLRREWPEDGPPLLWKYDSLHMGHSSPAVTKDAIYVTGMPDSTTGVLYCLDLNGNLLWKDIYGMEVKLNYTGSRSTPVVAGNELYLISGSGELVCYDLIRRSRKWSRDFLAEFSDSIPTYGHAQAVLVDGNRLICIPGGEEHNVVCLNRRSGKLIWSCEGNGEKATYSSPILMQHNGRRIVVAVTQYSILGIDADRGTKLWSVEYEPNFVAHINTPVYYNGRIYMVSGAYEGIGGFIALELNEDGSEATILWERTDIDNLLSGFVIVEDLVYTCTYRKKEWYCLDAASGETRYRWTDYEYGTITRAGDRFYVLSNDGNVMLCEGSDRGFHTISSFKMDIAIWYPFAPLWGFPVIKDKRLYIRHKGSLFVYNIEA